MEARDEELINTFILSTNIALNSINHRVVGLYLEFLKQICALRWVQIPSSMVYKMVSFRCNMVVFIRIVSLLSLLLLQAYESVGQSARTSFTVTENDTTVYQLHLALKEDGSPDHFYRNIFTPVCITGECKPVYVNFYWDLLGNYMRYDLPEGEILTKMDHDEFTPADYEKLQAILINSSSLLKDIEMKDLITTGTENLADSVDAKTGATLKAIKNEVIDGAVYTCHTLWHIAYGKIVVAKMRAVTESLVSDDLLLSFLRSKNHHYQYWAMEKTISAEGKIVKPDYWPAIQGIIEGDNIFAARHALQKVAIDVMDPTWLWQLYKKSNYAFQNDVLKKLALASHLDAIVLKEIVQALPQTNAVQTNLFMQVLQRQDKLPLPIMKDLVVLLESSSATIAEPIYTLLEAKSANHKQIKKSLARYHNSK